MRTRLEFRQALLRILEEAGVDLSGGGHLYFQPPETVRMRYPAIVYELSDVPARYADNQPYRQTRRYMVTVIDKDPDSTIWEAVSRLPSASFNRFFTADNLNHWALSVYF